jgi:hypothetical protein
MGEQNFERAVRVLEPLELTPETEAQWMELADLALQHNQVRVRGDEMRGAGAEEGSGAVTQLALIAR